MVLAIIQALTSEKTSQLELLISLEKLVLQNIAVSRESTSVLGQVIIAFNFSCYQYLYHIKNYITIKLYLFLYNYFQFSNIIRTREKRGLDTDNILALLVHIYALAGTEIQFSSQQEQQLKESIADAVFEDIMKLNKNVVSNNKMSVYQQTLLLFGL